MQVPCNPKADDSYDDDYPNLFSIAPQLFSMPGPLCRGDEYLIQCPVETGLWSSNINSGDGASYLQPQHSYVM